MKHLLTLGHGYCAAALAARLLPLGWQITGTARSAASAEKMRASGVTPLIYPCNLTAALVRASHILISAAPDAQGDVFLAEAGAAIRAAAPKWVGYLSTTAVYGDHGGGWVDEETPCKPQSPRATARVLAERQWLETGLPVHIFRLAGIYGPGRGPFSKIRDGSARQIIKQNQVFSRIHVDDIAQVLAASMAAPDAGQVYNLCDNNPAPPEDVLKHAAALLGLPPPPVVDFETADLPEMTRSFYAESKRVRNNKIKEKLGIRLLHPTYQAGLRALGSPQSLLPRIAGWGGWDRKPQAKARLSQRLIGNVAHADHDDAGARRRAYASIGTDELRFPSRKKKRLSAHSVLVKPSCRRASGDDRDAVAVIQKLPQPRHLTVPSAERWIHEDKAVPVAR